MVLGQWTFCTVVSLSLYICSVSMVIKNSMFFTYEILSNTYFGRRRTKSGMYFSKCGLKFNKRRCLILGGDNEDVLSKIICDNKTSRKISKRFTGNIKNAFFSKLPKPCHLHTWDSIRKEKTPPIQYLNTDDHGNIKQKV